MNRFKKPYEYDNRVKTVNDEPSMTKQEFTDDVDINRIMDKAQKGMVISHFNKNFPRYDDMTGIEFTEAMQKVAEAQSLFQELPSSIRTKFDNSPAKFLDWIQDEKNYDEARELGFDMPEAPAPVEPVPEPVPEPAPEPEPTQTA
jgi:phage internal scaffolding protein